MIVLHGSLEAGRLRVWGEVPPEPRPAEGKRPRGKRKSSAQPPVAKPSPFDAGPEQLCRVLGEAVPGLAVQPVDAEPVTAWLPTRADKPLASSPLIAEPPEPAAPAELAPWTVTALRLSAAQTLDLLCACVGKETLAPGVVVGKPLAFWANALRFAGTVAARQQFLPGEDPAAQPPRAHWDPVLAGRDAQRLAALARAMPSACRALDGSPDTPPTVPASVVLSSFLGEVLDHIVRTALPAPAVLAWNGRGRQPRPPTFDSLHDQWLHALRAADGTLHGDGAELTRLADQVREWRRPIAVSTAAPFRLCFRLEEPPGERDVDPEGRQPATPTRPWYVRYLLQAAADPSLLVPANDAWEARGRLAGVLQRSAFNPREYLLAGLGQAAAVCPRIEDSLKTATPSGYNLDVAAAHEFLTQKAWLLEQAGFGVLLPAWWTRKGTKLRLTAQAHVKSPPASGSSLSLGDFLEVDWTLALGDQPLSLKELETLARLKAPLVQVRGQWVQLNADEIQAAIDFWKKRAAGQATVSAVVQMALGQARAPGGLAFGGVTATGWISDFLARLEGRAAFEELPPPEGFHGTLRPYQVRGYSWLGFLRQWGLGACLADDMGLGKTVQTLALVERDWQTHHRPVLLICPMSVVGNWQKEAARFTPDLPVLVHHGLGRARGEAFAQQAAGQALVLTSYGLLHRDFQLFKVVDWMGVILDEAQNIKNPETKQAQAARALRADFRCALTGTPVENHVGDLWSLMEFLNPGFLGTWADFRRRFFVPIQAGQDAEAAGRLKRLTGPFVLRRLKTDKSIIADLPDKLEMKVFCNLTREQASLYAAVVKDATEALNGTTGIQRKGVVLATLSKLKQVCNHPAQFLGDNSAIPGRSGKLARLTEMLEEALETGDRVLVFTQFAEMGEIIRKHLQETFGHEVLFLHGGVAKKQRDRMVARFQESAEPANRERERLEGETLDGPRIFVLSLKAGGTGLNLTAANHVFHYDRWWNPAVENQATDRAFRIGQRRNVQVHKFLCAGTLEEKIDDMIERKQQVAGSIVGSGEAWLTELSTAELKELFALRPDAVGE
jgi:SNF2 family DNA or RNA helicase